MLENVSDILQWDSEAFYFKIYGKIGQIFHCIDMAVWRRQASIFWMRHEAVYGAWPSDERNDTGSIDSIVFAFAACQILWVDVHRMTQLTQITATTYLIIVFCRVFHVVSISRLHVIYIDSYGQHLIMSWYSI